MLGDIRAEDENLDVFFRLWCPVAEDGDVDKINELATQNAPRSTPLCTKDPVKLKLLLEAGFTGGLSISVLRAISDIVSVFFGFLGIEMSPKNMQREPRDSERPWEGIDPTDLGEIVRTTLLDEYDWDVVISLDEDEIQDWILMQIACLRPEMMDYIIELLQREPSHGTPDNKVSRLASAVDLIFFIPDVRSFWFETLFGDYRSSNAIWEEAAPMLKILLDLGADASETKFWQRDIWRYLVSNEKPELELLEILNILLDAGADPEMPFQRCFITQFLHDAGLPSSLKEIFCGVALNHALKLIDISFLAQDPKHSLSSYELQTITKILLRG
ncbi:hypothetical protein TWF569_006663 [Orbilia oligospora]|nr:hypothetical protein TWF706_011430 [Orbilia oligospora]KAF3140039.1 hypothetical protein TWF594_006434 [Orbilia oligospora]KAF3145033.1 hypothetical protein TWF569_006663 [Orbilia oligospora]